MSVKSSANSIENALMASKNSSMLDHSGLDELSRYSRGSKDRNSKDSDKDSIGKISLGKLSKKSGSSSHGSIDGQLPAMKGLEKKKLN